MFLPCNPFQCILRRTRYFPGLDRHDHGTVESHVPARHERLACRFQLQACRLTAQIQRFCHGEILQVRPDPLRNGPRRCGGLESDKQPSAGAQCLASAPGRAGRSLRAGCFIDKGVEQDGRILHSRTLRVRCPARPRFSADVPQVADSKRVGECGPSPCDNLARLLQSS